MNIRCSDNRKASLCTVFGETLDSSNFVMNWMLFYILSAESFAKSGRDVDVRSTWSMKMVGLSIESLF
jgi:hypothetical protein